MLNKNPDYITVPDWVRNNEGSRVNYEPKVRTILTEAEYDTNPEQTRRMLGLFVEEVEHDVTVSPIDGQNEYYDREALMSGLKKFVEAANDPRVAAELKDGLLGTIPEGRGLRDAFEQLSSNAITGPRIVEAVSERVRLYEIEQEALARRKAAAKGRVAFNGLRLS